MVCRALQGLEDCGAADGRRPAQGQSGRGIRVRRNVGRAAWLNVAMVFVQELTSDRLKEPL